MKRLMIPIAFLAWAGTASADDDSLAIIGSACLQGNQGACLIYQSAIQQQAQQQWQMQQSVDSLTRYLQNQEALRQQQWNQPLMPITTCRQNGFTTICQ